MVMTALHDAEHDAFDLVTLHEQAATLSFKEKFKIMQSIRPHIGNLRLKHISLDLCSPDNVMLFMSSNPTTGYNICTTSLWKMDGSISPSNFKNKEFYWWDETYLTDAKNAIMLRKENAHGFSRGFMISKKVDDFYLVYSFALQQNNGNDELYVQEHRDSYALIGDIVYMELRNLYQQYCPDYAVPNIRVCQTTPVVIKNE